MIKVFTTDHEPKTAGDILTDKFQEWEKNIWTKYY